MEKQVEGIVVSVAKQWWLKINTKPVRFGAMDGAIFPHIMKVKYVVDGKDYYKRAWIKAGLPVPEVGSSMQISYDEGKPSKAKILETK